MFFISLSINKAKKKYWEKIPISISHTSMYVPIEIEIVECILVYILQSESFKSATFLIWWNFNSLNQKITKELDNYIFWATLHYYFTYYINRKCKNIVGHFAVLLAKSNFYYWPKLEKRSKISLVHICAPKLNL